jgi:hypothetical protein
MCHVACMLIVVINIMVLVSGWATSWRFCRRCLCLEAPSDPPGASLGSSCLPIIPELGQA